MGFRNVAKPELGTKRQCGSCGTKFFDLKRERITCPKCGAAYQPAPVASARAAPRAAAVVDDEDKEADVATDLVPLEEADAAEGLADVADVEDVEVEGDDAADDTFLEEEEGADDVSGLIDGDLETDEEP